MTKIPPLPEPAREAEEACASWRNASPDYFTADQMNAHALATWNAAMEAAAKKVEAGTHMDRWASAATNSEPMKPCKLASAIRSMKEPQ